MKKNLKKIISLTILTLAVTLIAQITVFAADNDATQNATSSKATTIHVVGKVADTSVTSITFPEGAPSATVSLPYNNVDGSGDAQVITGTSEPVVRFKNTSGGTLSVWIGISSWTDSVAASEDYELVATTTTDVSAVDDVLSADGTAANVDTSITMDTGTYKALYLELVLSASTGKTGSSTLTILGES